MGFREVCSLCIISKEKILGVWSDIKKNSLQDDVIRHIIGVYQVSTEVQLE